MLMPCLRYSSVTGRSTFPSPRIARIWVSVNLDFLTALFRAQAEVSFFSVADQRGSIRNHGYLESSNSCAYNTRCEFAGREAWIKALGGGYCNFRMDSSVRINCINIDVHDYKAWFDRRISVADHWLLADHRPLAGL